MIEKGWKKSGRHEDRLKLGVNKTHSRPGEYFPEKMWCPKTKPEYPELLEYILNPK